MGYTHYCRRAPELPQDKFSAVVNDLKKILPKFRQAGIPLAGWDGSGEPEINDQVISFNGLEKCGHERRDIGITWPAPIAGGARPGKDTATGAWFAGALLEQRTCGGDCAHETFRLERIVEPHKWQEPDENGMYFTCCKTAYKPYDIAVTAALVIAKHHLGDLIIVHSDGTDKGWFDAKQICQMELGYGMEFALPVEA